MGKSLLIRWFSLFVLVVILWSGFLSLKPAPAITPSVNKIAAPLTGTASVPWPAYGQGAIGAEGHGVLAVHGTQTPVPIASVSKVITALAVLQKRPLSLGEQGPTITITQTDVDSYNNYYANDGSVTRVILGEQISEYQALEAVLLPSANNMADTLARWAFGTLEDYEAYANQMVKGFGLSQTTVSGPSGFSDKTLSTAEDLVLLGEKALANPVIARIVAEEQADIPIAGTIRNVNWLLGSNGVVGIKTGNTEQAGGCYLFASERNIAGHKITVIGALLAAPTLNTSLSDAKAILASVDNNFEVVTPVKKGQVLASYAGPWGVSSTAIAQKELSLLVWKGQQIKVSSSIQPLEVPAEKDALAGAINIKAGGQSVTSMVTLSGSLPSPSLRWRLTHSL